MTDPKRVARMAGLFSLLLIATAAFLQGYVSDRLIVSGDAATTAANFRTQGNGRARAMRST
jgi:hypothetical protein